MPFWELTVPLPVDLSEGLTNFLWEQGALGLVEEETPGLPPRLRAFFPESVSSTALARSVGEYLASLRALGLDAEGVVPAVVPLLDADWAEAWRRAFAPLRVGRRLLIVPPREMPLAEEGREIIIIEPGRAFGTGTHGSTRACLLLEGLLHARNGVADRIRCLLAGPGDLDGSRFPLVLANLLTGSHLANAPCYRRLVSPAGCLILGGILVEKAQGVLEALGANGFTPVDGAGLDGWVSLLLGG